MRGLSSGPGERWRQRALAVRAARARERQLDCQRRKAQAVPGNEDDFVAGMREHSRQIRERLSLIHPIDATLGCWRSGAAPTDGSSSSGKLMASASIRWPSRMPSCSPGRAGSRRSAAGEELPFADATFDVVLCDNVVDHAESPARIVAELARGLAPEGLLYFTVNIHHPLYHLAATVHSAWRALGVPFEVRPFRPHGPPDWRGGPQAVRRDTPPPAERDRRR